MSIANAELLYPETALAIAVIETGGFRARRLMKTHNWFGFRRNRRGFQVGQKKNYGVYATPEAMLADYASFEAETCIRHGLNSEKQFRAWLNTHYAEDPQYSQKLASTLNLIETVWN